MPPLSSRNSPSLLQRLSDRRRGLALVGLAAAAVLGTRAARRRAGGSAPDHVAPPVPDAPVAMPVAPSAEAVAAASEPNTEELAAAEIAVLAVLSQDGRLEIDRTALGVATALEREATEIAVLLRALHRQGHVAGNEYTATGEKIWFVTESGSGRLD